MQLLLTKPVPLVCIQPCQFRLLSVFVPRQSSLKVTTIIMPKFLKSSWRYWRYQAERVGADLRDGGKQTKCVSIKVRYADFTTITRQRTLPQLTDLDQTIFEIGNNLLEKAVAYNRLAIRLIGIGVSNLSEPGMQLSLMNNTEQRLEKLNRAVDRIRDKYGFAAIQTGRTIDIK